MTDAPRRLTPDADLRPVLALLRQSFAYMERVIDPPSSLTRMELDDLRTAAADGELWVLGDPPVACMILTRRQETLYLGKLAVDAGMRGQGLARRLMCHATGRARAMGLASVTLQTRVELRQNQAFFESHGFVEIERSSHPGYARLTTITYRRDA